MAHLDTTGFGDISNIIRPVFWATDPVDPLEQFGRHWQADDVLGLLFATEEETAPQMDNVLVFPVPQPVSQEDAPADQRMYGW
jgi:hypothetical protein